MAEGRENLNNPSTEIRRLISELDSLKNGEYAATRLVECGPSAIEPLRTFLLQGTPSHIFQPRFWAVGALARLKAKDVLLEYLSQERAIADPEDRFGEEAVESAAARALAAWPDENMFRSLLKLSERRMLNGLIAALAEYKRPETVPYFERALEDDFYRREAERALMQLGKVARAPLVVSAVTPRPTSSQESPSSLNRRRSAVRLLDEIGVTAEDWTTLRRLIDEPDDELMVGAAKAGIHLAAKRDRTTMARRLVEIISSAPWHLREDIENLLVLLKAEAASAVDSEIVWRMKRARNVCARDERLRMLLGVKRRFEKTEEPKRRDGS